MTTIRPEKNPDGSQTPSASEPQEDFAPILHQESHRLAARKMNPLDAAGPLLQFQPTRFQPGELVLGRFRIVRLLGRGGMGEVFEAEDLQLGRIALKTIRSDISASPHAFERFRREVQLARRVTGPQVCRIHELFLLPAIRGHPAVAFLTMEFLDGVTLLSKLRASGPLPPKEAKLVALDICEGLGLIHQQGIVHRDLKSANIMLCVRNGRPRAVLMDFGLALDDAPSAGESTATTVSIISARTGTGVVAGTPAYMAPEQFEGKKVSPATDIYAFGVVLYEILTALRPYAADTPVEAAIRRARRPPPASSIQHHLPHHWDRVVEKCLEYEPERRFQSAEQVARELRASPLTPVNVRKDHPRLVQLAAVLLLAAVAWGLFAWWQTRQYYRPNADGEHWYQAGLAALREGSYLKATRALDNAVRQDSRFVMAHARLAEAWANLDFDGLAQREMLIASAGENRVPPLDRMYLDAIRATLTRDFRGALARYRKIFDRLPDSEKPAGYVDLGMAYERAGDPKDALENYTKAQRLDPQNPAPFLRAAVLETRLDRVDDANRDFGRSETIYKAEMNPEGQAELDYQQGYLANEREDNDRANAYLKLALSEAQQISSVQLEIRALTQLSSVASNSGDPDRASELAQEAIRLARDNQLSAWAADGLVRLATAELDKGEFPQADDTLREAFQILQQNQQYRVEALAQLTLASLRNQEHRNDEVIVHAQAAVEYYRTNGPFAEAARASLLIGRAERSNGQLQEALQSGNDLLAMATRSKTPSLVTQAQELLGFVYLDTEDYPHALDHFRSAFLSAGTGFYRPYEALDCADVLARVGEYADSERMLALTPPSNPFGGEIRVEILLSQRDYAEADELATSVLSLPTISMRRARQVRVERAIARAYRGNKRGALAILETILQSSQSSDSDDLASIEFSAGTIYLATGKFKAALYEAETAAAYYESKNMLDSELQSSLSAVKAARGLGDSADSKRFATKVVDILTQLSHTWPSTVFHSYISRPDIRSLLREITPSGRFGEEW